MVQLNASGFCDVEHVCGSSWQGLERCEACEGAHCHDGKHCSAPAYTGIRRDVWWLATGAVLRAKLKTPRHSTRTRDSGSKLHRLLSPRGGDWKRKRTTRRRWHACASSSRVEELHRYHVWHHCALCEFLGTGLGSVLILQCSRVAQFSLLPKCSPSCSIQRPRHSIVDISPPCLTCIALRRLRRRQSPCRPRLAPLQPARTMNDGTQSRSGARGPNGRRSATPVRAIALGRTLSDLPRSAFGTIRRALKALPIIEDVMEEVSNLRRLAEVSRMRRVVVLGPRLTCQALRYPGRLSSACETCPDHC
jgi:hypothetical protein